MVSPESPAQFIIVHVRLALPLPPAAGHLVRIGELELAIGALPGDAGGVRRITEQLEEELPQLDLPAAGRHQSGRRRVQEVVRVCKRWRSLLDIIVYNNHQEQHVHLLLTYLSEGW